MTPEEISKEIGQFPKEYATMVKLTEDQKRILKGDIKSHEGMKFGEMYQDWKKRRKFEW